MKKNTIIFLLSSLICSLLFISNVSALDITIFDKINDPNSSNSWYNGTNENQEVEPGMVATQIWDLEKFDLTGNKLTVIGGFDNKDGVNANGIHWSAGDIFIDINGDAKYGPGTGGGYGLNNTVKNTFGYDYVFDLDFANNTYNVYSINSNSDVQTIYYNQNQGSNPWRYAPAGSFIKSGNITYYSDTTDYEGIHYAFSVNLADLGLSPGTDFLAHYTMECGNDDLMGKGKTQVPEPSTLLFLGAGLLGLGFAIRRRKS